MRSVTLALTALLTALSCSAGPAGSKPTPHPGPDRTQSLVDGVSRAWLAAAWEAYASRFLSPEGRIVDNGNAGISHSEGQGYGLLLAAKAGDAKRFETLWRWTQRTLMVRQDGLAAWKWDPAGKGVVDPNNATDGDVLIAWGLAEGSKRFGRPDYRAAAERLARAVGANAVVIAKPLPYLLPGVAGFRAGEQPDGPVVNPSYWVFPALTAFTELAPAVNWTALRKAGLALVDQSRFGTLNLPTDWESLAGPHPRPAANFPQSFGYNAIRIPLYLALDGGEDARAVLRRFAGAWTRSTSPTGLIESKEAAVTLPVWQPGYDLVLAVARCVTAGEAVPPEMISTRSDLYYPETLRLLSVIALQERFPSCL